MIFYISTNTRINNDEWFYFYLPLLLLLLGPIHGNKVGSYANFPQDKHESSSALLANNNNNTPHGSERKSSTFNRWEIDPKELTFQESIGSGSYGRVYKGIVLIIIIVIIMVISLVLLDCCNSQLLFFL